MADDGTSRKIGAGAMRAALRQGGKEIGTALKAFPDSISVDEPGSLLSPTQGEIAEDNRSSSLTSRVQDGMERAANKTVPERGLDRE